MRYDDDVDEPLYVLRAGNGHDLRERPEGSPLAEERNLGRYLCVSLTDRRRTAGGITILPWHVFLDELWAGEYRP